MFNPFIETQETAPISHLSARAGNEIQRWREAIVHSAAGIKGEAVMTNVNTQIPAQHSAFNGAVANLFTGALVVMAGVLTFAIFMTV